MKLHKYGRTETFYRFLMLTSIFPTSHATKKTVNRPKVKVAGLRSASSNA